MSRFLGVKDCNICIISDVHFNNENMIIVEVPEELKGVSNQELMTNYRVKNNKIELKQFKKITKDTKIAFVNNWAMECGIATYSSLLNSELVKSIPNFKLFVEYNSNPIDDMNILDGKIIDKDKVIECWRRGESMGELVDAIENYDPDIILIEHEFGLFPNARHWLSLMSRLSKYRAIVIMHSVFYHMDKAVSEACIPEIIVHLEGAVDVLKNHKQISGNVYLIPHGCTPFDGSGKLWNCYKSDHTFISQGFGFRYKRYENCIKAVKILKNKYSDVFFTALLSESPFNKLEHQIYYEELLSLAKELGVEENVGIIRGFQSEKIIDTFLKTNQVAVFPYGSDPEHIVYGASGASRVAMTKGVPVITSRIPHFSDLPTIKADTPEEIAKELDILFSDNKAKEKQIEIQNKHLISNSWDKIADMFIKIFDNQ